MEKPVGQGPGAPSRGKCIVSSSPSQPQLRSVNPTGRMCSLAGAALTKWHRLGGVNNGNLISHSYRGKKCKVKVGLFPETSLGWQMITSWSMCLCPGRFS